MSEENWSGGERRAGVSGEIHSMATEIKLMAATVVTLEKQISGLVADMKEFQKITQQKAYQDYQYLDDKIEKRFQEAKGIAEDAKQLISDHILISKTNEKNGQNSKEWIKWILPTISGLFLMVISVVKLLEGKI